MDIFYINIIFFEGVGNDATDPRHQTAIAPPFIIIINIMIIGSIFHFIRFFSGVLRPTLDCNQLFNSETKETCHLKTAWPARWRAQRSPY